MTNFQNMRTRLLESKGIPANDREQPDVDSLARTEWSPEFERLMRNRMIMGGIRYGTLRSQKTNPPSHIYLLAMIKQRLEKYADDGNTEHLVDAANICLVAFEIGTHPKKHFYAQDRK